MPVAAADQTVTAAPAATGSALTGVDLFAEGPAAQLQALLAESNPSPAAVRALHGAWSALPPEAQAQLKLQVLAKAATLPPLQAQKLATALPEHDPTELTLYQARGSLLKLAVAPGPEALSDLQRTLTFSGVSATTALEPAAAVRALHKSLGLPGQPELSASGLSAIEQAQKNQFMMMQNLRNILHDEILQGSTRSLERAVGKGDVVNLEALGQHLDTVRSKYTGLIDTTLPSPPTNAAQAMRLYEDTLKARSAWLQEARSVMRDADLFGPNDLKAAASLFKGDQPLSHRELKGMAFDNTLPLRARDAARKLTEHPRLFDAIWSVDVNDTHRQGKLSGVLHPPERSQATITQAQLQAFEQSFLHAQSLPGLDGKPRENTVSLPRFYDARSEAAQLYDATKVSGNGSWAAWSLQQVGLPGLGTHEDTVRNVLTESATDSGRLQALKRDYERMYGESVDALLRSELSGGDLGEALYYHDSSGQDIMSQHLVGTPERAQVLLARIKPQIAAIGANNGLIAHVSGHSGADERRKQDLETRYAAAEKALQRWQTYPSDRTAQQLTQHTADLLMRVEADQHADIVYQQTRQSVARTATQVGVVTTATVVTVVTAGTGAPAMGALTAAVLAGTAAGTVAAGAGSLANQYADHSEAAARQALDQDIALGQQTSLAQLEGGDAALRQEVLMQAESLMQQPPNGFMPSGDVLLQDTWNGAKSSFVASLSAGLTAGLGNGATAMGHRMQQLVGHTVGRQAAIGAVANAVQSTANALIQPLQLGNSKTEIEAALHNIEQQIVSSEQKVNDLSRQIGLARDWIKALEQPLSSPVATQNGNVTPLQTQPIERLTREDLETLYFARMLIQNAEAYSADMRANNEQLRAHATELRGAIDTGHTGVHYNLDTLQSNLGEHLAYNLALSSVIGALSGAAGKWTDQLDGSSSWSVTALKSVTKPATDASLAAVRTTVDNLYHSKTDDIWESMLFSLVTSGVGQVSNRVASSLQSRMMRGTFENLNNEQKEALLAQEWQTRDGKTETFDPNTADLAKFRLAYRSLAENQPEMAQSIQGTMQLEAQVVALEYTKRLTASATKFYQALPKETQTQLKNYGFDVENPSPEALAKAIETLRQKDVKAPGLETFRSLDSLQVNWDR